MSLLRFLGLQDYDSTEDSSKAEAIRQITSALDELPQEEAHYLAAFAYLLGRVAHADRKISSEETRVMEQIIAEKGKLSAEQAVIVVQMAKTQNRLFGHVEDFLVTREFSRVANRDQKLRLLDCLFAVSAADHVISMEEDREIRQIASEIRLGHGDFIRVRSRYRHRHSLFQD